MNDKWLESVTWTIKWLAEGCLFIIKTFIGGIIEIQGAFGESLFDHFIVCHSNSAPIS